MLQAAINTSLVRLAEPEDVDELVQMARELHRESALRDGADQPIPFSEKKARQTIESSFESKAGAIIGIIGEPGGLEGSVCVAWTDHWYSDHLVLQERWNFVRPEYRKTQNAKVLINFSKLIATVVWRPLIMSCVVAERPKMRLYERTTGCESVGGYFVFNPDRMEA